MLKLASYALSIPHSRPQVVRLVYLPQNFFSGAFGKVAEIFENLDLHVLLREGLVSVVQLIVRGELLLLGSGVLGDALGTAGVTDC